MSDKASDFIPRNYQVQLAKIAYRQNSIIYLPTGSGKTFIALLVLRWMSGDLNKSYSQGGKISIIVINTVALAPQHVKNIKFHTELRVEHYTGEKNVDFWSKEQWLEEYDKYQVLVISSQILLNIILTNFIDIAKINLLIFDECHHGVDDHSMRQIMKAFRNWPTEEHPRVIGLTATLLNGSCSLNNVMNVVRDLEVTYNSQVATVDELEYVIGYSTNPKENFIDYRLHVMGEVELIAIRTLNESLDLLKYFNLDGGAKRRKLNMQELGQKDPLKLLKNAINNIKFHIENLGIYGGSVTLLCYIIQLELLKVNEPNTNVSRMLTIVITTLNSLRARFEMAMEDGEDALKKITKYSSNKVVQLIAILRNYKLMSQTELCAIIFVDRRFTAQVMYHLLDDISKCDPELNYLKTNFVVGFSNNPYNKMREKLFVQKKNRCIIQAFINKELNVLISSNTLEEGIDIPKCSLVVKFDKSLEYRSYIQSKGRARHKDSLYYTMIQDNEYEKYMKKYSTFQNIESLLNNLLVNKNDERELPSSDEVDGIYNEDSVPPYYVDGPSSAHVTMQSSVTVLTQYCNDLPGDRYTNSSPDWYVEKMENKTRVAILLPTVSPIIDPIYGPFMSTRKLAKRGAALEACIALHKIGALDNTFRVCRAIEEQSLSFLFKDWPEVEDKTAGKMKNKRFYEKLIPNCLRGSFEPGNFYMHYINITPKYNSTEMDDCRIIEQQYTKSPMFALLTKDTLPKICDFDIYDSIGLLSIEIEVNVKEMELNDEQMNELASFHMIIFDDLLKIVKNFLLLDRKGINSPTIILAPILKETGDIDYKTIRDNRRLKSYSRNQNISDKLELETFEEAFLHKIVTPWYRIDVPLYIVRQVLIDKSPLSPFPNEEFSNFVHYYASKHNLTIHNHSQPLILVKAISKRNNFTKPPGIEARNRRAKRYEQLEEYFIPELVIKQELPASLWIQANCLPTILSRLVQLLRLDEIQKDIAESCNLAVPCPRKLTPDENLLTIKVVEEEDEMENVSPIENSNPTILDMNDCIPSVYNKDYESKLLEAEYPWSNEDEPKDIMRELNINTIDLDNYVKFIEYGDSKDEPSPKSDTNPLPALTYTKNFTHVDINFLTQKPSNAVPNLVDFYEAFTTKKANEIINLERLETLGDSFLKFITSFYIYFRFPKFDEGLATQLKGRMISNKNLYYLASSKGLGGAIHTDPLAPKEDWVPPCFCVPEILNDAAYLYELFNFSIQRDEQLAGVLSESTITDFNERRKQVVVSEDPSHSGLAAFMNIQCVNDKTVADVTEALLGAFFKNGGISGAITFLEWMSIIPASENLGQFFNCPVPNPLFYPETSLDEIDFHIPQWQKFEKRLGYHFNNRAYLLQALTHSSYTPNRLTPSYQKLEFLGDAILDFLITCHIFESCGNLNPGALTDLRSALVNNNTLGSLTVRCGFHKFLLLINQQLQHYIDKFVEFLTAKNFVIDDEVLILLEENEYAAENIDVPKILGDIFEALVGAVYLDSNRDLQTVWKVFYKIMWKEIDLFSSNVPKNILRRLYEYPSIYPSFDDAEKIATNRVVIRLNFTCDGRPVCVYGIGSNKIMAKRAAAKIALRFLNK